MLENSSCCCRGTLGYFREKLTSTAVCCLQNWRPRQKPKKGTKSLTTGQGWQIWLFRSVWHKKTVCNMYPRTASFLKRVANARLSCFAQNMQFHPKFCAFFKNRAQCKLWNKNKFCTRTKKYSAASPTTSKFACQKLIFYSRFQNVASFDWAVLYNIRFNKKIKTQLITLPNIVASNKIVALILNCCYRRKAARQ
jgi:hypothetical protein